MAFAVAARFLAAGVREGGLDLLVQGLPVGRGDRPRARQECGQDSKGEAESSAGVCHGVEEERAIAPILTDRLARVKRQRRERESLMQIAALVFDSITPLDIVGPIEVLARMPGAEIVIVGKQRGSGRRRHREGNSAQHRVRSTAPLQLWRAVEGRARRARSCAPDHAAGVHAHALRPAHRARAPLGRRRPSGDAEPAAQGAPSAATP